MQPSSGARRKEGSNYVAFVNDCPGPVTFHGPINLSVGDGGGAVQSEITPSINDGCAPE